MKYTDDDYENLLKLYNEQVQINDMLKTQLDELFLDNAKLEGKLSDSQKIKTLPMLVSLLVTLLFTYSFLMGYFVNKEVNTVIAVGFSTWWFSVMSYMITRWIGWDRQDD